MVVCENANIHQTLHRLSDPSIFRNTNKCACIHMHKTMLNKEECDNLKESNGYMGGIEVENIRGVKTVVS